MFAAFLSPDMTYSCPIWLQKSDPRSSEETLEQAQMRKLRRFITNARIKQDDHVLEIGTGWGSFAILAVKETGCRVTSLTLSTEQKALAEQRIAEAGLTDRIEVLLCDYRALPTPRDGKLYDKVVSIEMLEAVGKEYLDTYFQCIDKLLKPEGGVAVFQCITMPESVSQDRMSRHYDSMLTTIALRCVQQLGRLYSSVHLPRRPSSNRHSIAQLCQSWLVLQTHSRIC